MTVVDLSAAPPDLHVVPPQGIDLRAAERATALHGVLRDDPVLRREFLAAAGVE